MDKPHGLAKPAPDARTFDASDVFASQVYLGGLAQKPISNVSQPIGVTIRPAQHKARPVYSRRENITAENALDAILPEDEDGKTSRGQLIQSSFNDDASLHHFSPNRNGFVRAAIQAYSRHHHLTIRPEDIWFAILTQLSSYINAHAEELRGTFVAHEGKKELVVEYDEPSHHDVDWTDFVEKVGGLIQEHVVDPDLRRWIRPAFSTTTDTDVAVANIIMMASMQAYFEYTMQMTCGLPAVTLLGEKMDYEIILARMEKLRSYGKEPEQFADLLEPILKRFIMSFEDPESEEVRDFWQKIFTSWNQGSGSDYYSGWITAFMFWDEHGKSLYARDDPNGGTLWVPDDDEHLPRLRLNGIVYHRIEDDDIPHGFCTVPVKIKYPGGTEIMAEMVAGSVGTKSSSSGEVMEDGEVGLDRLQPVAGWWAYEKATDE